MSAVGDARKRQDERVLAPIVALATRADERFGLSRSISPESLWAAIEQARQMDAGQIQRAAKALRTSRLSWGTHSDRWGDVEWQREFWTEAATIALTAARVTSPGDLAAGGGDK